MPSTKAVFRCSSNQLIDGEDEQTPTKILAPSLQNLELYGASIESGLDLPWEQIKLYRSTNADLEFIGYMQNLEEITIDDSSSPAGSVETTDTQTNILPNVRHIEYNFPDTVVDVHNWLFIHYNFESLRTLVFNAPYSHPEDASLSFRFILPSVLELSLQSRRANFIRDILLATPNVQSLHIDIEMDPENVMNCSTPGRASVGNLRRLKHLSISQAGNVYMILSAMDTAVTSLKVIGLHLETISFYSPIQKWEGREISANKWIAHIQGRMANSLLVGKWTMVFVVLELGVGDNKG
ncbi:hypothetical protein CYLTODRAFT_446084 [Cylindrobasidium torrendii FP15055 ss-10]|uniref:Uncharacterized protein n=1 Tax=Cylindrobasidium torrendii FP15055 ss-10 TaxID=1314674 RepID=A0A0D7B105_9AGAR|nr:hypothetical protein CYLTODRAFT_446084 [Cylindrobasidium torrendii FP15055 ss-10]